MTLTLCVLVWARDGGQALLTEYEDRVLALVSTHGGQVLARVRSRGGHVDDAPHEVQVLGFPNPTAYDAFMNDPSRLELAPMRDRAVARTQVIWVDPVTE